jgi:hypothetical protein
MNILNEITSIIADRLGRNVTPNEFNLINELANSPYKFDNKLKGNRQALMQYVTNKIYKDFIKILDLSKASIDLHSYLSNTNIHTYLNHEIHNQNNTRYIESTNNETKNEVPSINISNIISQYKPELLFNPSIKYKKDYMILDTRYRLINGTSYENGRSSFQWGYSDTSNTTSGNINSISTIKNLISIKIYQFIFPSVTTPGVSSIDPNTYRISLLINEFIAQAFVASDIYKYHWLFGLTSTSQTPSTFFSYQAKVEDFNKGMIKLDPINTFDTLTLSFGNMNNIITFPYDRANVTFTYGNPTILTTVNINNLTNGSRVFLTDFRTTSSDDNALVTSINNPFGLIITVIDDYNFSIAINTAGIVGPVVGLSIECYFAQWRIILPMEFTFIED